MSGLKESIVRSQAILMLNRNPRETYIWKRVYNRFINCIKISTKIFNNPMFKNFSRSSMNIPNNLEKKDSEQDKELKKKNLIKNLKNTKNKYISRKIKSIMKNNNN